MAENMREIKGRMKAVGNIQRITKTMQMIATARFQAMQKRATEARAYTEKINQMVGQLARALGREDQAVSHPLITPPAQRGLNEAGRHLLLVLTTCDIMGVGPGTWNNWKATLLRTLYRQTSEALATGLEDVNREAAEGEAKAKLREALADWDKAKLRQELGRHYGPYWQGLQTDTQAVFARLLDGIADDEIRIDIKEDTDRDATRVCFAMADHPGIFARLAGSLALVGANVVDARTYTSKDGYATAVFWVQDADGAPYDSDRMDRLEAMIHKTLSGEVVARDAMVRRDRIRKRERAFRHPTTIAFDNEGSDIYTIVEVDTRDRPGLLHDLARTLAANNIYIASAQIATYGAQAVDTFYVKDMFGLKIVGRSRLATLERKLKAAVEAGANKAAEK